MPYLSLAEYKSRSVYDPSEIEEYFTRPGLSGRFEAWERTLAARKVDDKLRRRYAVPFASPPETVKDWLTAYMDARFMRARRDPGSEAEAGDTDNTLEATEATREIENAANPDLPAHPELPLAAGCAVSGVTRGGPHVITFLTGFDYLDAVADARRR